MPSNITVILVLFACSYLIIIGQLALMIIHDRNEERKSANDKLPPLPKGSTPDVVQVTSLKEILKKRSQLNELIENNTERIEHVRRLPVKDKMRVPANLIQANSDNQSARKAFNNRNYIQAEKDAIQAAADLDVVFEVLFPTI